MKQNYIYYWLLLFFVTVFNINVNAQNFVAPFGSNPDPNIVYHNGWYYYTGTSGNGVHLKKAQTLEGLKHTPSKKVFSSANGGPCCDYWAPEMFRINNKWYIYYTAKYSGEGQRTYVIENTADDPMSGTWVHKGKIYDSQNDVWAIDGTVLQTNGQLYFIWSGVAKASDGNKPQRLYIGRMSNPWTMYPGRVLLASPQYSWEKDGNVNEGPAIIKNKGKIFLTYSANGCWTNNYLIATLYMTEGANPMNAASWTKHDKPLFTKFPDRDAYGPGHHSFFKSPDGKEDWFVYHATPDASGSCDMGRSTRAQKLHWDANGFPSFGIPDPTGAWLTAPSGEPLLPVGNVLPNGIYKIKPTSSTNKVLDVSGCSAMRGTNVHQWQDNGLDCQKWHIIATPDGYYSINSVKGGLALEVEGCSSSNAANVQMWTPSGSDCQKWIIEEVSAGVYRIKSKKSGKVLDIQFGGDNNGANLQIYEYVGNAQQHFKIEKLDTYSAVAFESHNLSGHFIRSLDGRARIDKNITPQQDGQWRMVPGLAGKGVSFQSVNYPDSYLRHKYGRVYSEANDGSAVFREDATYYVRPGLADASKVSFESYNYPGNYIRHKNYLLYSESVTAGIGYNDATFSIGDQTVAPVVAFSSPADNSTYTAPANIFMVATASVPHGTISKVEFYNGSTLVGTEYVAPYTINWKNVSAGTYTITAKAYDSKGVATTSASRVVTVQSHVDHPPMPFAYSKVVIYKDQMKYNPTNEFIFPSVIRTDHIANPLGKYYLYYGPHDAPGGICLAYSDSIGGPFIEYANNPIVSNKHQGKFNVTHVASPHVVWMPQYNKYFMYFHGENTTTRWAYSTDGINWELANDHIAINTTKWASAFGSGFTECSYAKVFEYAIPGIGDRYTMVMMLIKSGYGRRIGLATSNDGKNFTPRDPALVTYNAEEGKDIAGPFYFPFNGRHFIVYNAASGNIHYTEVGPAFDKEIHHGVFYDPKPDYPEYDKASAPFLFYENDRWHMFYDVGIRLKQTVGLARVVPPTNFILDNNSGSFSSGGSWVSSTATEGYYGSDYLHDNSAVTNSGTWAKWKPTFPVSGYYEVLVRWPAYNNRPSDIKYKVYHQGNVTEVRKNQQTENGSWVYLGKYFFDAGNSENNRLTLDAGSDGGYTVADAAWFILDSASASQALGQTSITAIALTSEEANQFAVYPNPAGDIINFASLQDLTGADVSIIDAFGNEVYKLSDINSFHLDVSFLKAGIYNIIVTKDGSRVSANFVKE